MSMSVYARRRLFAGIAAAILSAASVAQVGCGVFHCVERAETAAAENTPPCHGGSSGNEGRSSHAPGAGDEECCRTLVLEPSPSHAAQVAPELVLAAFVITPLPVVVLPRSASNGPIDTGPPAALGVASMTPLRV